MKQRMQQAALAAALALMLAACGGGGDVSDAGVQDPGGNQVPRSATASATAWAAYAATLAASDTGTPVEVNNVEAAPTTETGAPSAL